MKSEDALERTNDSASTQLAEREESPLGVTAVMISQQNRRLPIDKTISRGTYANRISPNLSKTCLLDFISKGKILPLNILYVKI